MAKRIRGRNEGSLSQRSNGRWRAQVSQEDGRRISHDFNTKAEAQVWLRQIQGELEQGFDYQGSKTLLGDYLQEWLNTSKSALRKKTAYDYRMIIQKHVAPRMGEVCLKDLTPARVEKYYAQLIDAGVGVRTVRLVHSILHRALERAVLHGLLTRNPTNNATLPRYQQAEMQVLDEMQVNQLLVAASGSLFEALYHLAVKTGMRQGELIGLKWADLQWVSGRLYVRRQVQDVRGEGQIFQEPKTRSGRRTIQLGEGTLQMLRIHQERQKIRKAAVGERWQDNDLIFPSTIGTPLNASNLRKDFNRVIEKAGIHRIRFHDLRHSCASIMLANGIPVNVVSKILGHSKPSVTLDIYSHMYSESHQEASRLMDELVTPVKVNLPANIPQESSTGGM